jgi:alpha-tubulin suppressor-like RCC1 family protein
MGSNAKGQLGIKDPYVPNKHLPVLVEGLVDKGAIDVKCGDGHSVVVTQTHDVYAWGCNQYGQCAIGSSGKTYKAIHSPTQVSFENYYRPNIKQIECGATTSAFIDDIGRLFMAGRSQCGQLGLGMLTDEPTPIYVNKIPDRVNQVACGESHTLVLTMKGEVYVMGSN